MCSLRSQRQSQRGGFTLIELLIVMAIIAVLVSISIPAVMKAREASNRTVCANNLREFGHAFIHHQTHVGYLPTAGYTDYAAPTFSSTTISGTTYWNPYQGAGNPGTSGQDAGWGYQILPFIDAEPVWSGAQGGTVAGGGGSGSSTSPTTVAQLMQNAIQTPLKIFFCPARRQLGTTTYTNAAFPYEKAAYTQGGKYSVALSDYAGCNGTGTDTYGTKVPGAPPGNGAIVTQATGRYTITTTDIKDGTPYTLLLGEKAANPRFGTITNEDDMGYFAAYGPSPTATSGTFGANFNTIRFTSSSLLPLRDYEVQGATGGAFGSAHTGSFNGLMADGSVRPISYNISSAVYQALGTIQGNEILSDVDLTN
jgi:prepilin-type N-terminal cleavage/methylation domain-containing protein/prepilin-type processing-associated H-X9-DG protein